jgi:uncharacterized protein (TIGR03067 family)
MTHRMTFFALFFFVVVGLLSAAPVPRDRKGDRRPDEERILGEWNLTESLQNEKAYTKAVWIFEEGKMFSRSNLSDTNKGTEWKIKLNSSTSPKQIDIGNYPGIYEFDGDKLVIAYILGGPRPTELNSKNGQYYCVLERTGK